MRGFHPPFRARIAALSAGISGAILVAFGAAAWAWLVRDREAALDREIRALAYRHPGWLNPRSQYERLAGAIEFIFGEERKERLALLALDARGTVRYRSPHWPPLLDPASLDLRLEDDPSSATRSSPYTKIPRFLSLALPKTTWRLGVLGNDEARLIVGIDGTEMNAELARMKAAFLLALPAALAAIAIGGWWVAGRAVRPLRDISAAVGTLTARELDRRLPRTTEDPEIDRLTTVLNGLMDRLESSFRQATRFSADASHELKTPLAVMQAQLEQALQLAEDGSPHQRVYAGLLEDTQRLKNLARSLLLLAQADSGRLALSPARFPISDEVAALVDDAAILAEPARVELRAQLTPGLAVAADPVLVRLALSNLLDNAIRHNRAGGRVVVSLAETGDGVAVSVTNTGPGIPLSDQPRIFDRFHRGAEARARHGDGAGLGLSLAREILLAHQGRLVLVASEPDRTEFRLELPFGTMPPERLAAR